MHHPEHAAQLLRERTTWREPFEGRGSRDHAAAEWEDAAAALAGCSGLSYAAFMVRFSEAAPTQELLDHLVAVATRELWGKDQITPEQLVALLLREEASPEAHRKEVHRYTAAGINRGVWRSSIATPYARLAAEFESLISDAWRVARARLGD